MKILSNFHFKDKNSEERRPDLPDKMPKELVEELETMKNNEDNIINQNSQSKQKTKSDGILVNGEILNDKPSDNRYREDYSPLD